jgi:hypothetical protein
VPGFAPLEGPDNPFGGATDIVGVWLRHCESPVSALAANAGQSGLLPTNLALLSTPLFHSFSYAQSSNHKSALYTLMRLIGIRHELRQMRLEKPQWSLGDFAQHFGVSRERVRQLLKAEGLPTRRQTPKRIFEQALVSIGADPATPAVAKDDESKPIDKPLLVGLNESQQATVASATATEPIAEPNSESGTVNATARPGKLPDETWDY